MIFRCRHPLSMIGNKIRSEIKVKSKSSEANHKKLFFSYYPNHKKKNKVMLSVGDSYNDNKMIILMNII